MRLKIFSFFSGCGFLDLGFEKAGYEIETVNEYSKSFLQAYKYARQHMEIKEPQYGYFNCDVNLNSGMVGIIIFLLLLSVPGYLMILSTIPGFRDTVVSKDRITVSKLFIKREINVSDIANYKYNPIL